MVGVFICGACDSHVMPGLTRHPVGRLRQAYESHLESGLRRNDGRVVPPPPRLLVTLYDG